ncbi:MAG: hypothetical protein ACLRRT_01285 [Ruthenibacterium lactatiformans]
MHDPLQAVRRAAAFESTVLENGLTVRVHTMPVYGARVYGTKFGSIDRLCPDGKRVDLPAASPISGTKCLRTRRATRSHCMPARAPAPTPTSFDKTCYIFTASGNGPKI